MKLTKKLLALSIAVSTLSAANAQNMLPDPLTMNDGTAVKTLEDWNIRKGEISKMIQDIEIGKIPEVKKDQIKAEMKGDTLLVTVTVGKNSLTLSSKITYPKTGKAPYPLMIGTSHNSLPAEIFESRPIAMMDYHERQVNGYSQFRGDTVRSNYGFVKLYPELINNGAYSEWAWGFQRLIDGLEILGPKVTKIDTKHIGVSGCSYAGKMALFCGAFEERACLVIAQEPGGGGVASWKYSRTLGNVENLDKTDYHWFMESMKAKYHDENVEQLPFDHNELAAMICPRAFLMLGNTDYEWLADESAYVSMNSAIKVWKKFAMDSHVGYSINGGHPHCMLPKEQFPEVEAFIDRFLLEKEDVRTDNIRRAEKFEGKVELDKWIK